MSVVTDSPESCEIETNQFKDYGEIQENDGEDRDSGQSNEMNWKGGT